MPILNQALCKVLIKHVDSFCTNNYMKDILSTLYTRLTKINLPETTNLAGSEITLRVKVYASSFITCSLP